ncbi:MAG: hypothetical protein A2X34_06285 [Elusimicrobia bacterium GWC2_51_8]|nr:MAG: hypothetical protein A2X33_05775 [Elusimicrobia bacterium GWA2_51_34]OGR59148.1 MAG: hypothetical protein A2X34_06285 [Elusimicrobia bacterium GWC2_51_8]OGR85469.1 MAG: hypothetical protein A2021_08035 [Elusimicrobia bacterium GWF2_52_66]
MEAALEKYQLKKLYLLVNLGGTKNYLTSFSERSSMIKLMLGSKINSVELLPILSQQAKELANKNIQEIEKADSLYVFLGQDSYESLPAGYVNPRGINWVVVPRSTDTAPTLGPNASILALDNLHTVSSTEVRKLTAAGKLDEAPLDPAVSAYIKKINLYVPLPAELLELQKQLLESDFNYFRNRLCATASLSPQDCLKLNSPPFVPAQSVLGWSDNFIRKTLELAPPGRQTETLRHKLLEGLLLPDQQPRFQCLYAIPARNWPETVIVDEKTYLLPRISSSTDNHTLDKEAYLAVSLPKSLRSFISANTIAAYIHNAPAEQAFAYHQKAGFTEIYRFWTAPDRYMFLIKNKSDSAFRLVATNISTPESRKLLEQRLGYFMREIHAVLHKDTAPLFELNESGLAMSFHPRSRAVIGYMPAAMQLMRARPETYTCEPMTAIGLQISVCTNTLGANYQVFAENMYKDQMLPLMELLYSKGLRNFTYLGSAGGLSADIKCGDIVLPSEVETQPGKFEKLENHARALPEIAPGTTLHPTGREGFVTSVMDEDKAALDRLAAVNADCVELEVRYLLEFCRQKKDCSLSAVLFITDLPADKDKTLYANQACREKVKQSAKSVLEGLLFP